MKHLALILSLLMITGCTIMSTQSSPRKNICGIFTPKGEKWLKVPTEIEVKKFLPGNAVPPSEVYKTKDVSIEIHDAGEDVLSIYAHEMKGDNFVSILAIAHSASVSYITLDVR